MKKNMIFSWIALMLMAGMVVWMAAPSVAQFETQPAQQLQLEKTQWASKAAPSINAQSIRFLVIGDGGSGLSGQKKVAAQLLKQHQTKPYKMILMLGDNIYPDGDVNKYGKTRFLEPYAALLNAPRSVAFKPVLGNHDVLFGFKEDSIRFFKMPAAYYDFTYQGACFYALDTNAFDAKQKNWLSQRLKACRLPWKIVYGHHPIYTSGLHGTSKALETDLKPLLEQNKVQLYLAGHDHDYERFQLVSGVQYIVSGGGGASLRPFKEILPGSLVHLSKHHYMVFEGDGQRLKYQAIDTDGALLDHGEIKR